ncbi:hypothetical protein XELAEV_18020171mg [Xenopus laevis]|uniref:Uncharacterized protein n=1 Tax=Xenopus laevis TaxID=8355 RepID=A0A974D8V8_XENLA|nr:hypothetical protein XELAEV_18020171mg [Xenopus laevis]
MYSIGADICHSPPPIQTHTFGGRIIPPHALNVAPCLWECSPEWLAYPEASIQLWAPLHSLHTGTIFFSLWPLAVHIQTEEGS